MVDAIILVIARALAAVPIIEDEDSISAIAQPIDVFEPCFNGDVVARGGHIVVIQHALRTLDTTILDPGAISQAKGFVFTKPTVIPIPSTGTIASAKIVIPV
jgi:hypothetical protein